MSQYPEIKVLLKQILMVLAVSLAIGCTSQNRKRIMVADSLEGLDSITKLDSITELDSITKYDVPIKIDIPKNVTIGEYFNFMDSLVNAYCERTSLPLTEHLLVRNNRWVIDTLANTDYYRMMARDSFVHDQRKLVVLPKGSTLLVPDAIQTTALSGDFDHWWIDVNIPEFKLRLYKDSSVVYAFPIRVGQNRKRFLAMDGKISDLRTRTGSGSIVRHVRNPDFYNPVDGKRFYFTKRDDGLTTYMPQIPWLETEIDAQRNGQMIHPTTNPESLGKAYSNGCIGVKEADAWIIYYYAPVGTKIQIRYDLEVKGKGSDTLHLKDIYGYRKPPRH